MRKVFARLKDGQTASAALAATKREFLQHPRFARPRFWAPFILAGAG